jgi:regulator of sigma E protease
LITTVLSFLLAIGLLVAIHEYGHYRVAVACGVKVLRFSVGFGKPLIAWRNAKTGTEYTVGWIPLGGYVRMLDEREAPVDAKERDQAFNTQPLRSRVAIVAAGPIANLLLAIVLFASVHWLGQREAEAVLASPVAGSIAERAGFVALDRVTAVARVGADNEASEWDELASFEQVMSQITRAALDKQDLRVRVQRGSASKELTLSVSKVNAHLVDASLMRQIGIVAPYSPAVLGELSPDGAASKAGLLPGDRVVAVDGQSVPDALFLRERIRANPEQTQIWQIERAGQSSEIAVKPARVAVDKAKPGEPSSMGRVGAVVGSLPAMVTVRLGPIDGVLQAVVKTWDTSWLSLKLLGRMLIGDASIKNLSGPLTIADYAGKSAQMGLVSFLAFLAFVSVSLGVLNLLPLPVLDGGHLMYYLWEGIAGKPVPDTWQNLLQRGGVAVLLLMMSVALFNDFSRLLG